MAPQAVFTCPTPREALVRFGGEWKISGGMPENRADVIAAFREPSFDKVVFDARDVGGWDSCFIAFLVRLTEMCRKKGVVCRFEHMPDGAQRLIDLAFAVPPREGAARKSSFVPLLDRIGEKTIAAWNAVSNAKDFCLEALASLGRFFRKEAVLRKADLAAAFQEVSFDALGIVSLICFMVGLIFAFVGAIQLKVFGAQIYVASLVAIAMTRVMGAIMAGIIMAGRTGSSYAAVLGSMQVNEEVDALETMGIHSFDFLVLPRLLALSLMMPLMTVYADLTGILGGAFVGIFMLDLSPQEYFRMTVNVLNMRNILVGIVHGTVFGVIIALCGCYRGIRCGRSASSVGEATTAAVVTSIVGIILATAVITFICDLIKV